MEEENLPSENFAKTNVLTQLRKGFNTIIPKDVANFIKEWQLPPENPSWLMIIGFGYILRLILFRKIKLKANFYTQAYSWWQIRTHSGSDEILRYCSPNANVKGIINLVMVPENCALSNWKVDLFTWIGRLMFYWKQCIRAARWDQAVNTDGCRVHLCSKRTEA